MTFTLDTYRPDYLESLVARFNTETEGHAHVAPLTPERFVALVERKSYFDASGLFVAHAGGEVLGWAHACLAPATEAWQKGELRARLQMLVYPRERLEVGHALVVEATAWLERTGETELLALHAAAGYPFYRGMWYGGEPMGPATMEHVQLALEVGGYRNTQESVFMVAEAASPRAARASRIDLVTTPAELGPGGGRESWTGFAPMHTRARVGEVDVGGVGWTVLPQVADRLGAPCLNIWSLGVVEEQRRKGIATALLSHALREGCARGARFASVGTQLWNAPAHATYAKLGFLPYCVMVGRTKHVGPPQEARNE